ncbi:hypothetical protein HanPI659440_Chr08g0282381 [Helianthus annuus]|nr:hypothetical protein HanPI659440_Chr10g0376011 [Helianthus annuus]KAJ0763549.1 hypothetical protein HanPI659440_Chr08g0282381 [Helianthus annuus]
MNSSRSTFFDYFPFIRALVYNIGFFCNPNRTDFLLSAPLSLFFDLHRALYPCSCSPQIALPCYEAKQRDTLAFGTY